MSNQLDLTIVIPVRNEALNLPRCLRAIGDDLAKAIIVLDSTSKDDTQALARSAGVEVVNFQWNGLFPKKRNWFLRNYPVLTQWVLFLDADEILTEEFKAELRAELPNSCFNGYWLAYSIYFLGKKLKGGYPLNKLALFRYGTGEYERIDESNWSNLDMEVHEHPIITGRIGRLRSRIDHQDMRGIANYVSKHNDYSSWEAARFVKLQGTSSERNILTFRQRIKYRLLKTPFVGLVYFFASFFLMLGFRDGAKGFAFAILKMAYFTQVFCKISELQASQSKN